MLALEVKNLSKAYRLYARPVDRLLEVLTRRPRHKSFWALKDISFQVMTGETLGIIGDNGAGKSTLLKIMAGTLAPTKGQVIRNGRVAALLELGAGFHPELTGRQNIYLNASLLGLSEKEIRECEEEIIAFAELEEFIDQPIKTYSSGMYVRLAFSIATMVNPDILIVDEALSVGDQRFQKKSIDRIMEFRQRGKTILFCSHSMYHVLELCQRAIWLHEGRIQLSGQAKEVVEAYEEWCQQKIQKVEASPFHSPEQTEAWIESVQILRPKRKKAISKIKTGEQIAIQIRIKSKKFLQGHIGAGFQYAGGESIFGTSTKSAGLPPLKFQEQEEVNLLFPCLPLLSGRYQAFGVLLDETGLHIYDLKVSESFQVEGPQGIYGRFFLEHTWEL